MVYIMLLTEIAHAWGKALFKEHERWHKGVVYCNTMCGNPLKSSNVCWEDALGDWCEKGISSAESQKGINAVQWCSIENQKSTIAIDFCTAIAPFWFWIEHLWTTIIRGVRASVRNSLKNLKCLKRCDFQVWKSAGWRARKYLKKD